MAVNSVSNSLLGLCDDALALNKELTVTELVLPATSNNMHSKYAKFGLMILSDSSAGFFYLLPESGEAGMVASLPTQPLQSLISDLRGASISDVARLILEKDNLSRGIGMASINAVSQSVFRQAGFTPPENVDLLARVLANDQDLAHEGRNKSSTGSLTGDHVGMVGYFGPVVNRFKAAGHKLTVLELDESLFTESANFVITGDAERMSECTHIICSASTLINQTLEPLLQSIGKPISGSSGHSKFIELVGPTCGCFPDPLFELGIDQVGGSAVSELDATMAKIRNTDPWQDSVRKYTLTKDSYPGTSQLLRKMGSGL